MTKLNIQYQTEDKQLRDLCALYWESDDRGQFPNTVTDIAKRYGITTREVQALVRVHSKATIEDHTCKECGGPIYVSTRSDAGTRNRTSSLDYCTECSDRIQKQRNTESKRNLEEERSKALEDQQRKMHDAFDASVYESLDSLEFNFLVALASAPTIRDAFSEVGISTEHGQSLFKKFHEMHLIGVNSNRQYFMLDELRKPLQNSSYRRSVRSVFRSPDAFDAYRKLKQMFLFVFPEITLQSIVDKNRIRHLFTEDWHEAYFNECRLHFVICSRDGIPKYAIEYEENHAISQESRERIIFKKQLLNAVGLELQFIDKKINSTDTKAV